MIRHICENQNFYFLDFEADTKGNLYLAGTSTANKFNQTTLNSNLQPLAHAKGLQSMVPSDFFEQLVKNVTKKKCIIVAYSNAERDILNKILETKGFHFLKTTPYLNLLKAAKLWINRHHKQRFEALPVFRKDLPSFQAKKMKKSLASVMRLTNHLAPSDYAPGKTTKRIFDILSGLNRTNGQFDALTPVQKQKATKLIKHNTFDVLAMKTLLKKIQLEDNSCIETSIQPLIIE